VIVVLIGPPGAGKTKQGLLLKEREHVVWLSAGQLLRSEADEATMAVVNRGDLVDNEVVNAVLQKHLDLQPLDKVVLIDGFPRQEVQAKWLLDYSRSSGRQVRSVIHLMVPRDVTLERLKKRGRPDDVAEAVEGRLQDYEQNILPIVEYFAHAGIKIDVIDGNRPIEEVFIDIDEVISRVHKSQNR
jgi:adenylate kinase